MSQVKYRISIFVNFLAIFRINLYYFEKIVNRDSHLIETVVLSRSAQAAKFKKTYI